MKKKIVIDFEENFIKIRKKPVKSSFAFTSKMDKSKRRKDKFVKDLIEE